MTYIGSPVHRTLPGRKREGWEGDYSSRFIQNRRWTRAPRKHPLTKKHRPRYASEEPARFLDHQGRSMEEGIHRHKGDNFALFLLFSLVFFFFFFLLSLEIFVFARQTKINAPRGRSLARIWFNIPCTRRIWFNIPCTGGGIRATRSGKKDNEAWPIWRSLALDALGTVFLRAASFLSLLTRFERFSVTSRQRHLCRFHAGRDGDLVDRNFWKLTT